jgi:hypothetical protein
MKNALTIIVLTLSLCHAQAQLFISSSSEISFFSEAPLENIEATNYNSASMLNIAAKQLVFQIPIKGFEFEKDLMQEHFNENYLESDKYPKASFNGNINEDVDLSKDGTYEVTATGIMLIHGVEQERTIAGKITINGNKITLHGECKVRLVDHKVKIPKVVIANIAEEVDVKVAVTYKPYEKKK